MGAAAGMLSMLADGAGSTMQGAAQLQSGEYQSKIDLQNQQLANSAAADALQRGDINASTQRMKGAQIEGAQKVGLASSGVDTQSGSALQTLANTRMMSELDAQTIKNNAAREAWGYKVQGSQFGNQAALDKLKGQQGSAGTLLTGTGQEASSGIQAWAAANKGKY